MTRLHKPKAGFWIRLCVVILYPLDGLLFRIRWRNLERVPGPDRGGVIIAINHVSIIDTCSWPGSSGRPAGFRGS